VSDEHEPGNSRPRPVSQPVAGGTAVNCRSGGCRRITLAVDAHGLNQRQDLGPGQSGGTAPAAADEVALQRLVTDGTSATVRGTPPVEPAYRLHPALVEAVQNTSVLVHFGMVCAGWRQTGGGVVRSAQGRAELAGGSVIVLGIVLLVVGYFLAIPILWTLGIILVVIGVILVLLGTAGHAIGGRRHYY